MQTIAIVGASLAGISAARALRIQGFEGRLVIIGDEAQRPYDRPPLSKDFLAGRISADDLALEDSAEDLQAEWRLGAAAVSLDVARRSIRLSDDSRIGFDGVVIATGASARMLPEVAGRTNVHRLRTLEDARALREQLVPGARLVVIGAGFIGAEVASTARGLGLDVTVVEMGEVPLRGPLGAEMGDAVGRLHSANGVELICGARIAGFDISNNQVTAVRLDDGRYLPADVVVVGIGAEPNIAWLRDGGLELGNGVLCDSTGRTSVPGIVAVGDCAAWQDPRTGDHQRIEHWTGAIERPALAAAALLAGESGADYGPAALNLPYFWSDQYGTRLQFVGHAASADRVVIETGDPADHNFLAVYYDAEAPVAVLGLNQTRLFTKWRRALNQGTGLPLQPAGAS
ncbi:NAD(P)/FAD-dependent oxidoreductase [Specibacter cremeus]|uniref:NAD(P)/FAD-dependent oxidoreductase n=1 Tax=Specibacter cremeus TaxID=1629051 RepID=UPI000F775BE4|nr:FAD-dependent oxidoreductase [Specibacter cremeus]